jgi:hypothetical protein
MLKDVFQPPIAYPAFVHNLLRCSKLHYKLILQLCIRRGCYGAAIALDATRSSE